MATTNERRAHLPKAEKGHCRWCQKPVPKGRRSWCSQACVDEYRIRSDPGFVRQQVWKRDKGICALCGLDCPQLMRIQLTARRGHWTKGKQCGIRRFAPPRPSLLEALLARYPWLAKHRRRSTYWDADHIVPVVEGGGQCGLDGYRTLCIGCHQRQTAELAARRRKGGA